MYYIIFSVIKIVVVIGRQVNSKCENKKKTKKTIEKLKTFSNASICALHLNKVAAVSATLRVSNNS